MLKRENDLIAGRGIPITVSDDSLGIISDFENFIEDLQPDGVLPHSPPFEIHPYLNDFPLQNYEKYIIGTFPPISYACDRVNLQLANLIQPNGNVISPPWIPFFHGNQLSMWDFLLTNEERATLDDCFDEENPRQRAKTYLISILNNAEINYSDIIEKTQRKLVDEKYTAEDKNLWNICIHNRLINQLIANENAKYLLFNTSSTFGNGGLNIHQNANAYGLPGQLNVRAETNSFDLFIRGCQELGVRVDFGINHGAQLLPWTQLNSANTLILRENFKTKLIFEIRIRLLETERVFTVVTPFSPAAVHRGNTRLNGIVANWLENNPNQTPASLLFNIYQSFRNGVLEPLYQLNR